jgi:hypothetical protein
MRPLADASWSFQMLERQDVVVGIETIKMKVSSQKKGVLISFFIVALVFFQLY